jgi:hypothetical protein
MAMFDEYIACLNTFFAPKADSDVKRMLSTFVGSVSGTFGSPTMTVSPSETTLRSIVIPIELKPDEWPRFRYIFLELWRPQDKVLADLVQGYRDQCRKDVLSAFFRQKVRIFCRAKGIEETNVTDKDRAKMSKEATTQYESALSDLVGKLPEPERQVIASALDKPTPPTEEEVAPPPTEEEV